MFKRGDVCYILENNYLVRQVKVISRQGKFYTIQIVGKCGAIRLPESRLFISMEDAEKSKRGYNEVKIPDVYKRRYNANPHMYD